MNTMPDAMRYWSKVKFMSQTAVSDLALVAHPTSKSYFRAYPINRSVYCRDTTPLIRQDRFTHGYRLHRGEARLAPTHGEFPFIHDNIQISQGVLVSF